MLFPLNKKKKGQESITEISYADTDRRVSFICSLKGSFFILPDYALKYRGNVVFVENTHHIIYNYMW